MSLLMEKTALQPQIPTECHLPRRDWVLLPLLSLLTIALIAGSLELLARIFFSSSKALVADCMVLDDPSTGPRMIPNCTCRVKIPESQTAEYRFDRCGYREGVACGPKVSDKYRILVAGSSAVLGEHVQSNETFVSLLPQQLATRTHREIEAYNAGLAWGFPSTVPLRMNQILAASPDLIVWAITPADVGASAVLVQITRTEREQGARKVSEKAWMRAREALKVKSIATAILELFNRSRSSLAVRHFLYLSQNQHIKATLATGGEDFGFLRADLSPGWKDELMHFDQDFAAVSERAKAARVPLVVTLMPYSTQAAMISLGEWPTAIDPYKLDNDLRAIVEKRGGTYLDILPQYRTIPNPERGYFPVNGHANPAGHALMAQILANALTGGAVPALNDNQGSKIRTAVANQRQ